MNVDSPRCTRCDRTRMFRVRNVLERGSKRPGTRWSLAWIPRAVAFAPPTWVRIPGLRWHNGGRDNVASWRASVGHFETLICRACGYTAWYAREVAELEAPHRTAPCEECRATTPHHHITASERTAHGTVEPMRITRGMLGMEGFLYLLVCEPCGRVAWQGDDYRHLESRYFVHYARVEERDRPCLTCGATDAIVDRRAREVDNVPIPVVVEPLFHSFLHGLLQRTRGRYEVRLCRPCGSVEWYARDIEYLEASPSLGVEAIGDAPVTSAQGPYR